MLCRAAMNQALGLPLVTQGPRELPEAPEEEGFHIVWSTPGGTTGVEAQMQGRRADTVGRIKKGSPKHKAGCCGRAAGRLGEGMTATGNRGVQWSWTGMRQVKDTAEAGT